jgi:hypothetical protein
VTRRAILGVAGALAAAILSAAALAGASLGLALYLFVFAVGALVVCLLLRAIRNLATTRPVHVVLPLHPADPDDAAQQTTLHRALGAAQWSATGLHRGLRPIVIEVVGARLSRRYGIELQRQPDLAQTLVGARTWELVRPDRPGPEPGPGHGWSHQQLAELLDELEEI